MNNILAIRKRLGLRQMEFAKAVGVTQGGVSQYETGRADPSVDVARQVVACAKERGVSICLDDVFAAPTEHLMVGLQAKRDAM